MNHKITIIALLIGITFTIKANTKIKQVSIIDTKSAIFKKAVDPNITEVFNDEFISRAKSELTINKIFSSYYVSPYNEYETHESFETVTSLHDPSVENWFSTFTKGPDVITIIERDISDQDINSGEEYEYEYEELFFPCKLNLSSEAIVFDGNIKIGVSKSVFEQKFNISISTDTLKVSDLEGGNIFTFKFTNSVLSQIIFNADMD